MSEESGWKLVHGDVFRPPRNLVVLSAVVGTGAQLAMLVLLVILMAIVGTLYVGYVEKLTTEIDHAFSYNIFFFFFYFINVIAQCVLMAIDPHTIETEI